MNLGLRDAVALGTALGDVVAGGSDALLDAYAAQRRPAAEEVVRFAGRLTRLATVPQTRRPARNLLLRLLSAVPAARHRLAMRLSGLEQRAAG